MEENNDRPRVQEWLERELPVVMANLEKYFTRSGFSEADVKDLVAETLKRVWAYQQEIRVEAPLNFVYRVAQNVLREHFRKLKKDRAHDGWEDGKEYPAGPWQPQRPRDPEAECRGRELWRVVAGCLAKLAPADRELFTHYHKNASTRSGLATQLGLSLAALRVRACRIRIAVRECFDKKWKKA